MPWYVPWSESIKKRACRYLLQRYLGQFLEEKLTLDQLTVDLFNGIGSVRDVKLDVQALNELGEQQNLPVEFVDGYISEICVGIPWTTLLSDSSYVEVTGLTLTVQPKQRADTGVSMFESMWSSMSSSMQIAEECLKSDSEGKDVDQGQPLEGLELFAQTIDTVLSRVKVRFTDSVVRLEHVPKDSSSGVAVEMRIHNLNYFDEAGCDPPIPPSGDVHLQQTNKVYQVAAVTAKSFQMEGVTFYTDEFPSHARTFSRSVMSVSTSSSPESKHSESGLNVPLVLESMVPENDAGARDKDGSPQSKYSDCSSESKKPSPLGNLSVEPDPIIFGKLAGRQELRVQLKQTESGEGPKVNLKLLTGSLTLFLSARQLHVLLELVNGLSSPDLEDTSNVAPRPHCMQKPMAEVDYRRVEQELQQQLQPMSIVNTKGLQFTQGWSTAALDDSDDEFLPMQGGMSDSVVSGASSMDASTCSTSSSVSGRNSQRYSTPCASFAQPCSSNRSKKKHEKGYGGMVVDVDSSSTAEVTHFHVRVASVALVLLHEDVLTACSGSDIEGSLARSSVLQMKCVAEEFFKNLGPLGATSFGGADFDAARQVFLKACQLNHIRLLAAPIVIDGSEKSTSQGTCSSGTLMATNLELLECLIDKSPSQEPSVEYVELLKFGFDEPQTYSSDPCVKVQFKSLEKVTQHAPNRKHLHPHREFNISLQRCCCEIDVSIVDRITALLNPQPLCRRNLNKFSPSMKGAAPPHSCFYQAVEVNNVSDCKTSLKITSPFVMVKLRFPTPDLRPIHDMDRPPWWKRSVRKDFLIFELSDAMFSTLLESHEPCSRYEVHCRDLRGFFQEADTDTSVPFARATADDKNGNSFHERADGFGWPRLVVHVFPEASVSELETAMEQESEETMRQSSMEPLERSRSCEPSPFSSKRVIHESDTPHNKSSNPADSGEELIIPGNKKEMNQFIEHASQNTRLHLEISLPSASVQLTSKHLYELIYNRVNTDMFLWEPAAPKPQATFQADLYSGRGNIDTFLQDTLYTAFSMCKSGIQYDSDSDSEDTEGVYYSVCEQRQRQKRRQMEGANSNGQSAAAVSLSVGQGLLSVFAPVRDSGGKVIPGQHGELLIQFDDGNMFSVSGYKGKPGLGYICLQVNQASFHHNGLVATPQDVPPLREIGSEPPSYLEPTIYKSEQGALMPGCGNTHSDMLSVAIKIQMDDTLHNLKTFRVAAGLRGATLRHRMCPSQHSWFTQFVDFFDVIDYPVAGYDPPGVITELQMHLWNCSVDYRPIYLPLRSMITMGSFSVASNIAAQTSTSTLRFIAEEAALFLSDKVKDCPVNLKRDYVCVMDLGLFELSLRLSNQQGAGSSGTSPRVDLRASNNILHIRTCADSGKALADLLTYFASDGDLNPTSAEGVASEPQANSMSTSQESVLMTVTSDDSTASDLSQSQVAHVHDMMEEAMQESQGFTSHAKKASSKSSRNKKGVEVFFFPDEASTLNSKTLADSELFQKDDNDSEDNWEDDFCILDKEAGSGFLPKNSLPEVRALTPDPVRLIENHFSVPVGKTDLLNAPKHYPSAVLRYTLREMTVVWHIYGGKDFGPPAPAAARKNLPAEDYFRSPECKSCPSSPPFSSLRHSPSSGFRGRGAVSFSKSTPSEVHFGYHCPQQYSPRPASPHLTPPQQSSWQALGGPGRLHDVLMELQLNKVRFQHEVYPENTSEASRQVLLVGDVEIRDRLACSQINKFLYQYSSEAQPKQSHANMIVIKAVHIRPDPKLKVQECSLKVSLLPLRLNIDQDSLLFLFTFFSDISGRKSLEVEGSGSAPSPRHATPTHQPPVMTVNMDTRVADPIPEPQNLLIMLEDELNSVQNSTPSCESEKWDNSNCPSAPIFFRSFVFAPDVPIMLDYHGKRVDMTHGPLAGLLMGLGQLNCSELRLKRLSHRHGLLGFDKLVAYVISEWLRDIKKNQLPSLLGGVGPMHALVQLFQGIRDLFWMPIEQYQKDGRIVRGLQRGANSFTTSTAMAALELTNRLVQAIQATAELAFDMLSSGPSVRNRKRGKGRRPRYPHPADIREGVANAIQVMTEGLEETAEALMRAATEEHEQKGVSGAVGGVLRELTPRIVVKPIIMTTQATSNVLGAVRSQLVPDVRREAVEKWRVDL